MRNQSQSQIKGKSKCEENFSRNLLRMHLPRFDKVVIVTMNQSAKKISEETSFILA